MGVAEAVGNLHGNVPNLFEIRFCGSNFIKLTYCLNFWPSYLLKVNYVVPKTKIPKSGDGLAYECARFRKNRFIDSNFVEKLYS